MIEINIPQILNNIWPYLVAIILFLLLVVIHEFGHFVAAKSLGVKVNEFAVGFGPKLISKKLGETLYRVNLVPLGGYCAMEGEDESSTEPNAFCNKSPVKRLVIVVMGALFNLLLGLILVGVTLIPQKQFTTVKVSGFYENSLSEQTGLKKDDLIKFVDGRRIYTTYDLSYAFTNVDDGKLDITVIRNGKTKELKNVAFITETQDSINYVKVDFYVYGQEKTLFSFIKNTFKMTVSYCVVIWRSLIDLILGKYGISAMSGPVGVTAVIGNAARENLMLVIPIMALLTVNLGIFNLLPLPALDGGRALFIIAEIITRKRVPQKYESIIHTVGFAILILFMLFITSKDIWGLIK